MKILEYGYYDVASNEQEIKKNIKQALIYQPDSISVLPAYIKSIKNIVKDYVSLSSVIDYPFGLSCLESRKISCEKAIKSGATIIEMVIPNHPLCNKKYDIFKKDIVEHKTLCDKYDVELRYVLDYRIFTEYMLYKMSQILLANGVHTIYPSSNCFLDNLSDNILVSMLISKKMPINVIVNGNAWNEDHVKLLHNNNKIFGYKTNNIYTLEKISKFTSKSV